MFVKPGLRLTTPCNALVSALALATVMAAGCGDNRGDGVSVEDGSLNGEVAVYVADDLENQRSETQYVLRTANGVERRIRFETDPHLEPGTPIKIWGTELSDGLAVHSFKTLPKAAPGLIERVVAPLKDGMKFAAKRLAFVIVDIGGGVSFTLERAQTELTGPSTNTDPPLRDYYVEASYGTQDLDGRAFVLNYPLSTCATRDTSDMATALKPMVMSMGGGKFDHYLWFFGSKNNACSWSGLGEVGTPDKPTDDTWYNNSAGCVVMIQEPGHNFGMQHSSSMKCGSSVILDDPNSGCTHSEYGDRFDPMGGGCRHMNGWQKTYNGWLQGCNVVRVGQSGTFTLLPMELACDGTQMLQIPMPKTRMFMRTGGGGAATNEMLTHYYLELRTPKGVDTGMATSVLVHVSGPPKKRSEKAVHTWILDMEPASANSFEGMTAGKTFADPAGGVTFSVTELDASHATINVELTGAVATGSTVCLGDAPFTAPGPGVESCNAGPTKPGGGGASGSTGGAGGTSVGTGGRPGTGGSTNPGTGGRGGSSAGTGGGVVPGTGGGQPGSGGATAARTGGAPGSGGGVVSGTGGAPGTGGGVVPGTGGGVVPPGTGGATTADAGGGVTPGDVTGGCACSTEGGTPGGATALAFGAMLLLGARGSRRRRR